MLDWLLLAAAAFAADPQAATAPDTDKAPPPDITVSGKRPDVVQKIDRRVYTIPADAKAASSDGYALLRGLPAVTVGLNDTITLLGTANVTVLVDNKAPPEGNQVLRRLKGADIERIEVMTNPSAEYAPDGTGGIINIVLKKKRKQGLSGSIIADADSFGGAGLDASVKVTRGPWSFDTALRARRLAWKNSYTVLRAAEAVAGATPTRSFQTTTDHGHDSFAMVQETIGYAFGDKTAATLGGWIGTNDGYDDASSGYLGLTSDFASFRQQTSSHFRYDFWGVDFSVNHTGSKQGESLKFDANYQQTRNPRLTQNALTYPAPAGSADYQSQDNQVQRDLSVKLDYAHPMPGGRILSLGLSEELLRITHDLDFANPSAIADLGPSYAYSITGTRNVAALYASFQQPFGRWTLLPALRAELADFVGKPVGLADFSTHDANLYPSVHLSRPLAPGLDMNLSYARRTDRPDINQLNPFTVVTSSTSLSAGNPGLRNQTTDAYEANFSFTRKALSASLILYDRETARLWSTQYSVTAGGLTLFQPINAGSKADRGAEFDLSTPVSKRFKFTGSLNLFDSRVPIDSGVGPTSVALFRYTGNTTVEWNGPARSDQPGDSAQFQLNYESPSQVYQIHYGPRLTPSLTLSHPLARKLSLVLTAENAFGVIHSGHTLLAPLTQETLEERTIGPKFTVKFVKTIGR